MDSQNLSSNGKRNKKQTSRRQRVHALEQLEKRELFAFDTSNTEQLVNTLVPRLQQSDQQSTAIATNRHGESVVVFAGYRQDDPDGVFMRRFLPNGTRSDVVLVNVEKREVQKSPSVAIDDEGRFVVVWQGRGRDLTQGLRDDDGIFARWYDRDGKPLTGEILVNNQTQGLQESADVAFLADGSTLFTWAGASLQDQAGIYLRKFTTPGIPSAPQVLAHSPSSARQVLPSLAADSEGRYVVTWSSRGEGSNAWDVLKQSFGPDGRALGTETLVTTSSAASQFHSRAAMSPTGNSVIVWSEYSPSDETWNIFGRRFDQAGQPTGVAWRVNDLGRKTQNDPDIAVSNDGKFIVSWSSGNWDGSGWDLQARIYDANGQPSGAEFPIGSLTMGYGSGHQQYSAVAWGGGVNPAIAWSGRGSVDRGGVWVFTPESGAAPTVEPISDIELFEHDLVDLELTIRKGSPDQRVRLSLLPHTSPTGAVIHPQTNRFLWRPSEEQGPGEYNIVIRVEDADNANLFSDRRLRIKVLERNAPPTIASISPIVGKEGEEISFFAIAQDTDIPKNHLTYFLLGDNLPRGASIDPSSGKFRWTPSEEDGDKKWDFQIGVRDNGIPPLQTTTPVQISIVEVNQPPYLAPVPNQQYSIDQTIPTIQLDGRDPDLPAQELTYRILSAPAGTTIDPRSGILTIAQLNEGTHEFSVSVTDNAAVPLSHSQRFTISVVRSLPDPPRIAHRDQALVFDEGISQKRQLTLENGQHFSDYHWSIRSEIPEALQFTDSGNIHWTPLEAQGPGSFALLVRATSKLNPTLFDEALLTLEVREVNLAPQWPTFPAIEVKEETDLSFSISATDADLPKNRLSYQLISGPSGLTFDAITGTIPWRPSEQDGPGEYQVRVLATDNGQPSMGSETTIAIRVLEVNTAPSIESVTQLVANAGQTLRVPLSVFDRDLPKNALSLSVTGEYLEGVTVDSDRSEFVWQVPTTAALGFYQFRVKVQDNGQPPLSSETEIVVEVTDKWINIREESNFLSVARIPLVVPDNAQALKANYRNLILDRTDTERMVDAFEIALLDQAHRPAVATISTEKDAFFNISEGNRITHGNGTQANLSANEAIVDVRHLAPGTRLWLEYRLVANDSDVKSEVTVKPTVEWLTVSPVSNASTTTPTGRKRSIAATPTNFSGMVDVTDLVPIEYLNQWFDRDTNLDTSRVRLRNESGQVLRSLIIVSSAPESIGSTPSNFDGIIPRSGLSQSSPMLDRLAGHKYWQVASGEGSDNITEPGE